MFNTTSKNERKNLNLINQHKAFGRGELEIQVGTNRYTITRASEKYTKKLKGDTNPVLVADSLQIFATGTGQDK